MATNNLINLANPSKITNKGELLKINPDEKIKEEKLETNTVATAVEDLTKPIVNKDFNTKQPKQGSGLSPMDPIVIEVERDNTNKKPPENFLNSIADDKELKEMKNDDIEKEYLNLKKKIYPTENDEKKHEALRRINKMRKDGTVINDEVSPDDPLERIEQVESEAKTALDKNRKIDYIWHFIWMMCYIFELVVTKFGYGIRFNGWADDISHNKAEFVEYIRMMVSDYHVYDKKAKKYILVKNTSLLASVDASPSVLLLLALIKNAISFTASNNYGIVAKMLNKDNDTKMPSKKSEEDIENDIMDDINKEN